MGDDRQRYRHRPNLDWSWPPDLGPPGWPPPGRPGSASERDHAARWVGSIIDGLYLRCGDEGFDAELELRTLRTVLSRFLFR